jgi:hypothetical protein
LFFIFLFIGCTANRLFFCFSSSISVIYDTNEDLILRNGQEFEANLDIQKVIEICRNLCWEDGGSSFGDDELHEVGNVLEEPNPFEALYNNPGADMTCVWLFSIYLVQLQRNEKT